MSINSKGELIIQVYAMPRDTNPNGDIFGGWLMSQMDIAGGIYSQKIVKGRVVTVGIKSMTFSKPVFVGDTLSCFVTLIKIGKTSISVHIEAFVNRQTIEEETIKVTEGDFTYVKVDDNGKPLAIK
jgi:acyl-CoA thioesterase YciA